MLGNVTDLPDNSCSLPLSYSVQGETFVKIEYYASFRVVNCCWDTSSSSPVMHILYYLKEDTQSYGTWLRSLNLLKDTARRSSWNTFEDKNRPRLNVLPLGFPLVIRLHIFNIVNLILFHSITFTASGHVLLLHTAFSALISILESCALWFWKAKRGDAEVTDIYTLLISGCSWGSPNACEVFCVSRGRCYFWLGTSKLFLNRTE